MDPTLALGFGQMIFDIAAQRRQEKLQQAALNEQKRSARESEKLAKAGQTDAMGNKIRYIEGIGFVSEASPIVKAILDAGAKEQLANLKEDQPRERAAAIRQDRRSQTADSEYSKAFDKYRYSKAPNENEAVGDEVLATVAEREYKPEGAALLDQALRTNNPELLRSMYGAEKGNAGSLTAALIRAKQRGTGQYLAEKGARDQATFTELGQLKNVADGTGDSTPQFSNANEELSGKQSDAMSRLIQVISNNGQATSSAMRDRANSVKPLDISGISKILIDKYGKTPEQKALEEAMYKEALSKANLGYASNTYKLNQGVF